MDENKKLYTNIAPDQGLDEKGIRPLFIDSFMARAEKVKEKLGKIAHIETTDRLFERYDYSLSSPLPSNFDGETKYHELEFAGVNVVVRHYKDGIRWKVQDELKYLGSRKIEQTAKKHGEKYALIPWLMSEVALQDSTSTVYLPTPLTSYDGDTLVNASGDTRFGISGGNYTAGTSVTAEAAYEEDIITAICRFPKLLDEITNRPLWEGEIDDSKFFLLYGPALSGIVQKVFKRNFVAVNPATTTGASVQSGIISMGGFKIEPMFVPGMSGNSSYVVKEDAERKPLILLHGSFDIPQMFVYGLNQGHKELDDKLEKAVSFYDAWGIGINAPHSIIKIYHA
jgi:hypothetical protein